MISRNISTLRKKAALSQEALAEQLDVSRQTVAKWENGETVPDALQCDKMAQIFDVTVDDLIHAMPEDVRNAQKGKYVFGTVTIGDKGQIVIPVKARRIFHLEPGDDLLVLGDEDRGIALVKSDFFLEVAAHLQEGK